MTTDGETPSADICSNNDSTESILPAVAQASMAVVKATTFGDNPDDRAAARSSRACVDTMIRACVRTAVRACSVLSVVILR